MIVRLMGEGQWRVDDSLQPRLAELDAETENAVQDGDEEGMRAALEALHAAVRESGEKLGDHHLGPSDAVVPPVDLTLDEARKLLAGTDPFPDLL